VQGSGKSHTTSCLIGTLSIPYYAKRANLVDRELRDSFTCTWFTEEATLFTGVALRGI
jgi:hypothetical protein